MHLILINWKSTTVLWVTFVYFEANFQQEADEQYNCDASQYVHILSNTNQKQAKYSALRTHCL